MSLCVFDILPPAKIIPAREDTHEHFRKTVQDWYHRATHDLWYKSQMGFSNRKLEQATCYSRSQIKNFSKRVQLYDRGKEDISCQRVGKIMEAMEKRQLVFTPKRAEGAFWVSPPERDPVIPPLIPRHEWSLFARCGVCGDHKFLPVDISGQAHAACYRCLPPSQHPAIGATLLRRISLIREALIHLGYLNEQK